MNEITIRYLESGETSYKSFVATPLPPNPTIEID